MNSIYSNFNETVPRENMSKFTAQAKDAWAGFEANIVDFFHSYTFKNIIFTLKTISFILSLLALIAIIFIFFKMRALGKSTKVEKAKISAIPKGKKIFKKWAKIERKFKSGVESNYKLAVLEADNLYDDTLRIIGYDKEKILNNLDEIKNAKRIKRNIIDDSGFVLTQEEVGNALNAYKEGLEKLGAM